MDRMLYLYIIHFKPGAAAREIVANSMRHTDADAASSKVVRASRRGAGAADANRMGALERTARIFIAVAGGWLLCNLVVGWMWMAFVAFFGIERREAVILAPLIGLLLYLCVLVWAFGERSFKRLCVSLALGIALSFGLQQGLAARLGT
jgi:hypothetical protein